MQLDRPTVGVPAGEVTPADEAQAGVVEIVAVILVDADAESACTDEWIDQLVVEENVDR